ncbi:MAG: hypothetical protein NZ561_03315 [Phycisphaerae bacterium]|nr:hypothetical protein [Phycisphaerae bacterium]MDW8261195.1 hypothetical protein [Phycisphaerales bacterium]
MPIALDESPPAPRGIQAGSADAELPDLSTPGGDLRSGKFWSLTRRPLVLLVLISLLGVFLRLISLDKPALWGDEAFTYSRVCGSFREMLDILQFNGFMPLHYLLYWWIGQHFELTPIVMRLPVAIAGCFMPPVMYFLARQLGMRQAGALVVALFAACSAYLLCYSRDAKMYMPLWLFSTIHVGCGLWWLNAVGKPSTTPPVGFRFLCWLGSGVAMVAFHALGLVAFGVFCVIFLTHPTGLRAVLATSLSVLLLPWAVVSPLLRATPTAWASDRARWFAWIRGKLDGLSWWPLPGLLVGAVLILALPWLHFTLFTDYARRVEENWGASGINWVELYNRDRNALDLLKFTATAFLLSWEWPTPAVAAGIDPRALKLLTAACLFFTGAAVLGLLPWRTRSSHLTASPEIPGTAGRTSKGWLALAAFWILAWLALPAFVAYCRSIQPFYGPWTMLRSLIGPLGGSWVVTGVIVAVAAGALFASDRTWRGRAGVAVLVVMVATGIFLLLMVAYGGMSRWWQLDSAAGRRWHNVWMPRYLGVLWPAFAIALCALILRLPTRPLRGGVIALLLAVNVVQFAVRVWGGSEPPTDRIARDIIHSQPTLVRHQQLTLDVLRQTQAMIAGREPQLWKITRQLQRLPPDQPVSTRVYVNTGMWGPEPGGGVIGSFAMRYYLCLLGGVEPSPVQFRRLRNVVDRNFSYTIGLSPTLIAADTRADPSVQRIITWERLERGRRDVNFADPLRARLGPAWRRVDQQLFTARDHWTWMNKYQLRRREYVRIGPSPATQPTPADSPQTPKPRLAARPSQSTAHQAPP